MTPDEVRREMELREFIRSSGIPPTLAEQLLRCFEDPSRAEPTNVGGFKGLKAGDTYAFYVPVLRDIVEVKGEKAEIPSVQVRLKATCPEEAAKAVKHILALRSGLKSGRIDLKAALVGLRKAIDPLSLINTLSAFNVPRAPPWMSSEHDERVRTLLDRPDAEGGPVLGAEDYFGYGVKPKDFFVLGEREPAKGAIHELWLDLHAGKRKVLTDAQIDYTAAKSSDPDYIRARLKQIRDFFKKHELEVRTSKVFAKRLEQLEPEFYVSSDHTLMVGDLDRLKKFAEEKGWKVEDTGRRLRRADIRHSGGLEFDGGRFFISRGDASRALKVFRGPKILRTGPDMSWAVLTSKGKAIAVAMRSRSP